MLGEDYRVTAEIPVAECMTESEGTAQLGSPSRSGWAEKVGDGYPKGAHCNPALCGRAGVLD